jgi:hypothetical protein
VLGAWAACPFFSSEKSCLITSKKLLNGLPGYTEQKTKKKKKQTREKKKGGRERGREGRREREQTNERRGLDERKENPTR